MIKSVTTCVGVWGCDTQYSYKVYLYLFSNDATINAIDKSINIRIKELELKVIKSVTPYVGVWGCDTQYSYEVYLYLFLK